MRIPAGLFAVLVKEVAQILRDNLTLRIILILPVLELMLFGFAINSDVKHVPTSVVDFSRSALSRNILAGMEVSGYFRLKDVSEGIEEADRMMKSGDVSIIAIMPPDLEERALRGERPDILVEADMSDPIAVGGALSAFEAIIGNASSEGVLSKPGGPRMEALALGITLHKKYNPESVTRYNYLPGLQGVIIEICMLTLVGLSFARERERGTIEALLSLPLSPGAVMLGKTIPYVFIGVIQSLSIMLLMHFVFQVPFQGSLSLVLAACAIFTIASVSLGYLLSTFVTTQMQVMNVVIFYFLMSTQLTGFMFPFNGMPDWAKLIGEFLPLTHFMRILRAVMLKGADFSHVMHEFAILSLFIAVLTGIAMYRFRRTLD